MRVLRRALALLTMLVLVTGSLAVPVVSTMGADMAMSVDDGSNSMPDCSDCGRETLPGSGCAALCVVLPADLASPIVVVWDLPEDAPTPSASLIRIGRMPMPELHPPQAIV
jgi:hypothetical protein